MLQNSCFSVPVAAVVRRLASRFDKLKASGVTTAATTKPKPFGSAHGHRQASGYQTHGE
jgi:hypothetical protein